MDEELIAIAINDETIEALKAGEPMRLAQFAKDLPQLRNVVVVYDNNSELPHMRPGDLVPESLQRALDALIPSSPPSSRTIPVVRYDFAPECVEEAGMVFSIGQEFSGVYDEAKKKMEGSRRETKAILGDAATGLLLRKSELTDEQLAKVQALVAKNRVYGWFCHVAGYLAETGQVENFLDGLSLSATAAHRAEHRKQMRERDK